MQNIGSDITSRFHVEVRSRVSMNTKVMETLIDFEEISIPIETAYYDVLGEVTYRCWFKLYKIK